MKSKNKTKAKPKRKYISSFRRSRMRMELCLRINETIVNFKSKEEPGVKPNSKDIIKILSEVLDRKIQRY